MLTLFSIPKPFQGHVGTIQRNAIRSWVALRPPCEILLFGDEDGTAEVSRELGVRHVPAVYRNEFGTPLLDGVFDGAQRAGSHRLMCYINADIILMSDFLKALGRVRRRAFLLCGRRWNLDLTRHLDFEDPGWEAGLRQAVKDRGSLADIYWLDYFVFPRGFLGLLPAFAVGRPMWDNWLVYRARSRWGAVIDASEAFMAVHQNHDYSHVPHREGSMWEGPEARRNLELAGGRRHWFTLMDATHTLTKNGLKRAMSAAHLRRRAKVLGVVHPRLAFLMPFLEVANGAIKGARRRLRARQPLVGDGRQS